MDSERWTQGAAVTGRQGGQKRLPIRRSWTWIESVIALRPRADWPTQYTPRWYSTTAPDWAKRGLRRVWPEQQSRTLDELSRDLDVALRMPGYPMAIAPPIRTRIDMLTTGVRTPVGIKVFGEDLKEIARGSSTQRQHTPCCRRILRALDEAFRLMPFYRADPWLPEAASPAFSPTPTAQ